MKIQIRAEGRPAAHESRRNSTIRGYQFALLFVLALIHWRGSLAGIKLFTTFQFTGSFCFSLFSRDKINEQEEEEEEVAKYWPQGMRQFASRSQCELRAG